MAMSEWAKQEIAYAIDKAKKDDEDCGYCIACCESALRAFEKLCEDGHSGYSIKVTQNILNSLIDGRPLTPIEDTPEVWKEVFSNEDTKTRSYQCKRMSSLFKDVKEDGSVSYNDVDRTLLVEITSNTTWHNGLADRLVNERYPITMPYMPYSKPFKVYAEEFLVDPKNGDYDTIGYLRLVTPEGEKVSLGLYYKDAGAADSTLPMVQISKEEYEQREKLAVKKEDKNEQRE